MPSEIDLFLDYVRNARDMGSRPGTPASEQEIHGFELRYNLKLPPDMREYFLKINGVWCEGTTVPRLYELSEWQRLVETELYGALYQDHAKQVADDVGKYFILGICPGAWIVQLDATAVSKQPVYLLWDKAILIADSLSDFLQKYRISDGKSVMPFFG